VPFRFLFDEHVSVPACRSLRERGVDVVHVLEIGLKTALDPQVLDRAAAEGRILVTRNYADFTAQVSAYTSAGRSFPGVLFLPVSVPQGDVGAHVRAVERWIDAQTAADPEGAAAGRSPLADSFGWLASS
jgi:predicted nuclease of predicted toxin-antitoxin system